MLDIAKVTKYFGGLSAVDRLDLSVQQGEILGIIGPNGAGKTTVFNLITGIFPPTSGRIIFRGKDITGNKPHSIARQGIVRTFQLIPLFDSRTVLENMLVAFHLCSKHGFWSAVFNAGSANTTERNILRRAKELLDYVGLAGMDRKSAHSLPHGHRKLLGVAMALAASPKVLLLDEPVSGMNAEETTAAMNLIKKFREEGLTILLVEHNLRAVMNVCDRVIVLNFGRKIAEGTPDEIGTNKDVIEAYLGVGFDAAQRE